MPVYVIADGRAPDPSKLDEYRRRNAELVPAHGGRFLVRGGDSEVLEGDWNPSRLVVMEFPDHEAARAWYDSPEYVELRKQRQANGETDMVLVEGA
ncbi:MAG: hypothetical protein AVDCRST_MAG69-1271 [uncultured Solirubrobacteraceae bacterium]|uniref:DUF1330 domain-containing protein n=1 Tax=uncultured Solirubrobacteraceae bacterium TaxID=1162706 RepID=A0A6J4S556_9ACTN|nr:MAG: hypothetical protein AVDCRST_MAG69-1271 [uncultured Solirubrobacteraceae bacterium]